MVTIDFKLAHNKTRKLSEAFLLKLEKNLSSSLKFFFFYICLYL